jgi:hypothetical protein
MDDERLEVLSSTENPNPPHRKRSLTMCRSRSGKLWENRSPDLSRPARFFLIPNIVTRGDWTRIFQGPGRPCSRETASMLMIIAEHPGIRKHANGNNLPPSWYTLYLLTRLKEQRLDHLIATKVVHNALQRKHVEALLRREDSRERRASRIGSDDGAPKQRAKVEDSCRRPLQAGFFKPDIPELIRLCKRMTIDLEDAQDEIRRDNDARKDLRACVDRILTIADGDPVPVIPQEEEGAV